MNCFIIQIENKINKILEKIKINLHNNIIKFHKIAYFKIFKIKFKKKI